MARYIDIDDFRKNAYYADTDLDIGVYLAEHGCVDVAPRAEVMKEVVGYIERHLQYQRKKVDVPFSSRDMRNYQCGAIDVIEYFEELVDHLKKKYTEGRDG